MLKGVLYGPQGPDTRRRGDDTFGPQIEDAVAGPDNERFLERTRIIGKYTFGFSTMLAIGDVILINNTGGLPVALQRMKFHYVPWLGGTVAYVAGVNVCCNLRGGKTDQWNHAAGGFAAGAVAGKCITNGSKIIHAWWIGLGLSILGYWYKDLAMKGKEMFPYIEKKPFNHGNPFSHKLDYTTIRQRLGDRPGYWCRSPEEVAEVFKRGEFADGNSRDKHKVLQGSFYRTPEN